MREKRLRGLIMLFLLAREHVANQFVWFLVGCGMILAVSVIAFVQFRRMEMDHEVVDTHAYF